MIAIFTDEQSALAFDAAVSAAMGWPDTETKTERYAVPLKHPTANLWAMPVEEYAASHLPDGVELAAELSPDWLPPIE
jgi:hypothetical protein